MYENYHETETKVDGFCVRENKVWTLEGIWRMCVRNNFYTSGSNADYSKMLNFVSENPPTLENMFKVAKDIYEHTEDLEGVMCVNDRSEVLACILWEIENSMTATYSVTY